EAEKYLSTAPGDAQVLRVAAHAAKKLRDPVKYRQFMQQLCQAEPWEDLHLLKLAKACYGLGKLDLAIDCAEACRLRRSSPKAEVHAFLAMVIDKKGLV